MNFNFTNNSSAGGQGQGNPFGQQQGQNNPFGQTNTNNSPFGQTNTNNSPFGQTNTNNSPFGQTNTNNSPFGQPTDTSNPFGQPQTNPFGRTNTNSTPFNTNSQPQTNPSPTSPSPFGHPQTNSCQASAPQASTAGQNEQQNISLSIPKTTNVDKSTSFVQMNLYEIIQQQVRKLEDNIASFNEKVREIFIEDEKIMKALNNYKAINSRLDLESKKIGELEESLDEFEKTLEDFSKRVPASEDDDELILCVRKFEEISDSYNRTIENIKDEDDEVLGLVKENYTLCSLIDNKLDLYEKYQ